MTPRITRGAIRAAARAEAQALVAAGTLTPIDLAHATKRALAVVGGTPTRADTRRCHDAILASIREAAHAASHA